MLNWQDREYVNARKKVFKNLDTDEILNLELQDDPDNILQDSDTPLTAHNLNLAQQELVDDISKTYTGTNITADTAAGYGRINKTWGKTIVEGTGDKSLDNPYAIKCVGDDVNLFDGVLIGGTFNNGVPNTSSASIRIRNDSYISVESNADYIISAKYAKDLRVMIMLYDSSKTFITSADYYNAWKNMSFTFKTTSDTAYVMFVFRDSADASISVSDITEVKLQKGTVATPYSPYGYGTVEVKSLSNSIILNDFEQGSISGGDGTNIENTTRIRTTGYVELKQGTYTINFDGANESICELYDLNGNFEKELYAWTSKGNIFTISRECKARFIFKIDDTTTILPININNVEIKQIYSNLVYTDKPLCALSDTIQDELDYRNKKIIRRCEYVILDGSDDEGWAISNSYGNDTFACFYSASTLILGESDYCISNMFEYGNYSKETLNKNMLSLGNTCVNINLTIAKTIASTVDELKTWLALHPVIVIYELATPTTENIDCSDKIVQYAESTNIYNRDGAETEVELTQNEAISGINENINNIEEKQNKLHTYSEKEQVIGKWINGKPVYRKVVNCGTLPNATSKSVASNLTNLEEVIDIYGFSRAEDMTRIPIPFASTTAVANNVQISVNSSNNIEIRAGTNRSSFTTTYIVLEYTKTTD